MAFKELVKGLCETTKCWFDVYTKEASDEKFIKTDDSLTNITYSRGTEAPSGGKDGDIYDQYFD